MFIPETLTINQSPQHQFHTIEQSQQHINPFEITSFGQMPKSTKIAPELKMRRIYLLKDKIRKKHVWLEMKIYIYRSQNSIIHDETKFCRICLCDDGNSELIKPCKCKGSLQFIHENCLKLWILEKQGIERVYTNDIDCEVCQQRLLMETKFSNQKQLRMIIRAPKARLFCWITEIIVSLGIIGIIIALIYEIVNGRFEPLILAGTIVLIIILILIFSLIYASCIDQVSVEVLDPWKFNDVQDENDSKLMSIIELDNQNKQTIQIINKNDQRNDMQYSSINVLQIES